VFIIGVLTLAFYMIDGTNFVLNTRAEDQQVSWKADWKQLSQVVRNIRLEGEPLVITGWDATPMQYYLGETALSSSELERQSILPPHPSYLVITTPNSSTLPVLSSAVLLYEEKDKDIRIFRWYAP